MQTAKTDRTMTQTDGPGYGMKTLAVVQQLSDAGIQKISVLMRHSARHYDEAHLEREPLMWLTEEGKEIAFEYGCRIPKTPLVRFFSSMLGRCIETAYQAEKGVTSRGGQTRSNVVTVELAPSFVKQPADVFKLHRKVGTPKLFSDWFAGRISDDLVGRSDEVARTMIHRLGELLRKGPEAHIDIAVSHDWNLYMVKHHLLQLDFEQTIQVEYLEGIVIFEKAGDLFITSHECEALSIPSDFIL